MTKEEIYIKYGDVKLKLSSYYKFCFEFIGVTDIGEKVFVSYGGDSNEIYRDSFDVDSEYTIRQLEPNLINITKDRKTVVDWCEY